jgi:Flp pilus assembly pilin Flp
MVDSPIKREGFVAAYVRRDAEEGRPHGLQTAEYALVLGVVAAIVIGIMLLTGEQMKQELEQVVAAFAAAN